MSHPCRGAWCRYGECRMGFQLFTGLLMVAFLTPFVFASGCNKVPVTSMVRLARVDFETTDLSSVRAALLLPRTLRPMSGTGRLTVMRRHTDGSVEDHVFKLKEIEDPEVVMLNEETRGPARIYAYALPLEGLRTLERLRHDALRARNAGATGSKMTLGIAAEACHLGPKPAGPLPITTYLKTEETKSFVPLVRNIDLRTLTGGKPLDLRPCPR